MKEVTQRLNEVLVGIIDNQRETGQYENIPKGEDVEFEVDIDSIPKELRGVLEERLPTLWGKMSNGLQGDEKKKFYVNGVLINGSKVRVGLRKNW